MHVPKAPSIGGLQFFNGHGLSTVQASVSTTIVIINSTIVICLAGIKAVAKGKSRDGISPGGIEGDLGGMEDEIEDDGEMPVAGADGEAPSTVTGDELGTPATTDQTV